MYAYPTPGLPADSSCPSSRDEGSDPRGKRQRDSSPARRHVGRVHWEGSFVRTDMGPGRPKGETGMNAYVYLRHVVPALITRPWPARPAATHLMPAAQGTCHTTTGQAVEMLLSWMYSLISRYCRRRHAWNLRPAWKSVADCGRRNACDPPNAARSRPLIEMQSVAMFHRVVKQVLVVNVGTCLRPAKTTVTIRGRDFA